ncbi:MAG: adventurous gliding motility protein CglE [Myxococcota bacterium]
MLWMLATLALPQDAVAQDKAERKAAREAEKDLVREIERGVYVKSNVGSTVIFPVTARSARPSTGATYSGVVFLGLGVGGEFIDEERFSAAFEASFSQGLVQGPRTDVLSPDNSLTQGDVHMLMGTGVVEVSIYPTRRLGVGLRAGGGVAVLPLLMNEQQYVDEIVPIIGAPAPVHEGPLPMVIGGPTLEYYTKLSHFSIGADVDFMFMVGFNPGLFPSGYLKYTF